MQHQRLKNAMQFLHTSIIIIVYYAKMAADKKYVHKTTQKYKDKKAEMHDKMIAEADIQYNRNTVQVFTLRQNHIFVILRFRSSAKIMKYNHR